MINPLAEKLLTPEEIAAARDRARERFQGQIGEEPAATRVPKCRLTVIDQVVHASPEGQPILAEHRCDVELTSDEQPWLRTVTLQVDWQPLAKGCWLEQASCVCIEHKAARGRGVPTPEERARQEAKRVDICIYSPHSPSNGQQEFCWPSMSLAPGRSVRLEGIDLDELWVRASEIGIKAAITIFPI
jgi:hypothetical protein